MPVSPRLLTADVIKANSQLRLGSSLADDSHKNNAGCFYATSHTMIVDGDQAEV